MQKLLYLKHFAILFSGTAVAQAINFLSYPIIARLYSSQEFGLLSIFTITVMMLGAISCCRLDILVQYSKPFETAAVFVSSQIVNSLFSVACSIIMLALCLLYRRNDLILLAGICGASIFLSGYVSATSQLLLKAESYRSRSTSVVVRTVATAFSQVGLAMVSPTALSLIAGFFIGLIMQALVLSPNIGWQRFQLLSKMKLYVVIKRYRNRLLVDVLSTCLVAIALNAMAILVLLLYGTEVLGMYSMATRIAILPIALIATSMSEIFFQRAALAYRLRGTFWTEMRFTIVAAGSVVLVAFLPIILFGRSLVAVYLGETWLGVSDVVIILAPMLILRFVFLTIQAAMLIIGKQSWLLINNTSILALMIAAGYVSHFFGLSLHCYLMLTSVFVSGQYVVFLVATGREVRRIEGARRLSA